MKGQVNALYHLAVVGDTRPPPALTDVMVAIGISRIHSLVARVMGDTGTHGPVLPPDSDPQD